MNLYGMNLIPEGNFLNYIPNNGILANRQTEVKIFHNGENLYIGAVYHDTTLRGANWILETR